MLVFYRNFLDAAAWRDDPVAMAEIAEKAAVARQEKPFLSRAVRPVPERFELMLENARSSVRIVDSA